MAVDYPLEQLSPAFGAGADGGREATYDGKVTWSATTGFGSDSWHGYVVIQAKQRQENDTARVSKRRLASRSNPLKTGCGLNCRILPLPGP
ncbi:hypothetical protein [Arthrobacter sp. VKM Ac-2550]|uniref:hypothetical protein n=1 Tax=Crystallibacter permensis TaxID=1938888 RepID=UPI002227ABFD|nr:hypothetical protein [Arthrobacter sp. VKM Ac-2550]MCW2132696.1 hypothetical protein [Arthrobacter sp. VKM Ac-2550]